MTKVTDIFSTSESQGMVEYQMNYKKDGINFIGRGSENNGVVNTVDKIREIKPLEGNCITVAMRGSVMERIVQKEPFYSSFHIKILRPKFEMTEETLQFYCYVLRSNKWKYSFGRQANKTLNSLEIPSLDQIPTWVKEFRYPERINSKKEEDLKIDLDFSSWKFFNLGKIRNDFYLFDITSSKDGLVQDYNFGKKPYVSSTAYNNGVVKFVEGAAKNKSGTLTINRGGSVGEVFYQDRDYLSTPVDVRILTPKLKTNIYVGMFLCTILRLEKYRFNYSRKMGSARLKTLKIKLPSNNESNTPDFEFMERYIKSLRYSSELKKYN
jgi:hypothetical protein